VLYYDERNCIGLV